MHIVEKISSMFRLQPLTPKHSLLQEFYPLPFSKYITVYNESSVPANFYDYFNDVIEDILPALKKADIKIVQILNSEKEPRINNAYVVPKFSYSQLNFIIKNSLLHVSTDVFTSELAGVFGTKSVSLVGNRFGDNSRPWFDNDFSIVLSETAEAKPSFSLSENPKSINKIKTESVSNAILEGLYLNKVNYSTVRMGAKYNNNFFIDYIPNFVLTSDLYSRFEVSVRLDKYFSLSNCLPFCSQFPHFITTNAALTNEFLAKIKGSNRGIVFIINDDTPNSIADNCQELGFNVSFISYDVANADSIKLSFLGKRPVFVENPQKYDLKNDLFFKTNKIILSEDKKFASYAHLEKGEVLATINRVIPNQRFYRDIENFKIIKK